MLHRLKVSVAVVEFVRLLMLSRTQPIKASGSESRLVSRSRSSTQAEISGMRGANLALEHCAHEFPSAPFVMITSHDVTFAAETLSTLVRSMTDAPDVGLIGPKLDGIPPCGEWNGFRPRLEPASGSGPVVDTKWISGTCLLIRREAVLEVGGFESRFGSYVEDVDLGLRMRDAGWRVCVALHASAAESGSTSTWVTYLVDRNSMYLGAKRDGWRGVARPAGLLAWYALRGFIAALMPGRLRECRRIPFGTRSITSADWSAWRRSLGFSCRSSATLLAVGRIRAK